MPVSRETQTLSYFSLWKQSFHLNDNGISDRGIALKTYLRNDNEVSDRGIDLKIKLIPETIMRSQKGNRCGGLRKSAQFTNG